ncbi:MAG: radical SAM family heme chaperone HemW [Planctomycetes bacterium]|nr:radical SAM family heme chaperone HemW [Planctomycetota bacterium]
MIDPEPNRPRSAETRGPAGLYLHVPFCARICPYCDFAVSRGDGAARARYVDAVEREIELRAAGQTFDTIYFGGGTPSILSPSQIAAILDRVARSARLDEPRIFLEVNPEDVRESALAEWRALGIGTLSLGIQSFEDRGLKRLGRRHRGGEARRAVELAVAAGFATVSVDLIYGLAGQSILEWTAQLDVALELGAHHLSCYQLTFHEGTPFARGLARGSVVELDEESQAEFFLATHDHLATAGCPGYEVSNFARSIEHRSRHNQKYWDHTPYIGLGPSAHSFQGRRRSWNVRDWRSYVERIEHGTAPEEGGEDLDDDALALEVVMLQLRTAEGIDLADYERRFGVDLVEVNAPLLRPESGLEVVGSRLRATRAGWPIVDGLAARLAVR